MFAFSTDHDSYLHEDYPAFLEVPGFPYVRLSFVLLNDDNGAFSSTQELLLFVMHVNSGELLVVSTERFLIYKIPPKKSLLRRVASEAIGSVPVVGDILGGIDNFNEMKEGLRGVKGWVTGKARREAAQRKEEGMPTAKEAQDLVWDLRDPEVLTLLVSYKDRILLENAFGWKTRLVASAESTLAQAAEITVREDGLSFRTGSDETFLAKVGDDWSPVQIATFLADLHRPALESTGWQVDGGDETLVLKRAHTQGT